MKKKPVKKQSSSRVSSIAARVMRRLSDEGKYGAFVYIYFSGDSGFRSVCTKSELKALAASALSQDEQKGQRRGRK